MPSFIGLSTSGVNLYDLAPGSSTGNSQQLYDSGSNLYTAGSLSASNLWLLQSGLSGPQNTVIFDFLNSPGVVTVSITGNTTFTGSNYLPGHAIMARLLPPTSGFNLGFSSGWSFIGGASPSFIASGNVGVLSVQCFTNTDVGTVAAYAVGAYSTA